jgi:hypothetical protein
VLDADATLVLTRGSPVGGTALTIRIARQHLRPLLLVDLERQTPSAEQVRLWLDTGRFRALNIAGPRESQQPGIGRQAAEFLRNVLPREAICRPP